MRLSVAWAYMENALNNLMTTPEAQRLVALLGEQGFVEYLQNLFDKTGGNFDDTVLHMRVHALAVSRQAETGQIPSYQMLSAIPTLDALPQAAPTAAPTPAPRVPVPVLPTPKRQQTNTVRVEATPQQIMQSQPASQVLSAQAPVRASQVASYSGYAPSQPADISNASGGVARFSGGQNVAAPYSAQAYMTAGIGGYPGHVGEDYAYNPASGQRSVTNPIGGIPFAGYQPNGYGNYFGVIGGNPQEIAQMSPSERQALIEETRRKMPTAGSLRELAIPNRNVVIQGHLQSVPKTLPDYIATGSAQLAMGSTGRSTGLHTHTEIKDANNVIRSLSDFARQYGSSITYPKAVGASGGGVLDAVSAAKAAFNSIVRPIPTPTPKVSAAAPASRVSQVQYRSTPAPTMQRYSAPTPKVTPQPRQVNTSVQMMSKPASVQTAMRSYSAPRATPTPAPRSIQPMQSSFKAVSYSRPSPQQTFISQAQKTLSSLFKFK